MAHLKPIKGPLVGSLENHNQTIDAIHDEIFPGNVSSPEQLIIKKLQDSIVECRTATDDIYVREDKKQQRYRERHFKRK